MQKEDSRKDVAHTIRQQRLIYPGLKGLINKKENDFVASLSFRERKVFVFDLNLNFQKLRYRVALERMSQMCSILMLRGVELCV